MTLEFDSDEEFSDFQTEMDLIKHEAEEAGRYFNWEFEAQRYYPKFRAYRDAHYASAQNPKNASRKTGPQDDKQGKRTTQQNHTSGPDPENASRKISLHEYNDRELPTLPGQLIEGILRRHRKMLLAGPSKASKTGLLMELALALASGGSWLGFPCTKCRVLYIDLENDQTTSINRFFAIRRHMSGDANIPEGLDMVNWRGEAAPLDQLKDKIIELAEDYDVVILDPMYKIITGDENSATAMAYFCHQMDDIIAATGVSIIYCHHHSKGSQGQKKAMDRASGSGVFARDADALLDIIELSVTNKYRSSHEIQPGASAWRMEFTLREFAPHEPLDFWYEYPVHRLDSSLSDLYVLGSREANLAASRKRASREEKEAHARQVLENIFEALDQEKTGSVPLVAAARHANVSTRTIQRYVKLFPNEFSNPANSGEVNRVEA